MATCTNCGYDKTPPGKSSCFRCGRRLDGVSAAPERDAVPIAACTNCGYDKTPPGKSSCFRCGRRLQDVGSVGEAGFLAPGPVTPPGAWSPQTEPVESVQAVAPVSSAAPTQAGGQVGLCPNCGAPSRWEYSRIQVLGTKKGILISVNGSRVSFSSIADMLNSAGADGWEMVNMTTAIDSATGDALTEFAMKRPL